MRRWTDQEIRDLGVVTDLTTAGSIFSLGRTRSFELARAGEFPVPVLRLGAQSYRVPVAPILQLLGYPTNDATGGDQPPAVTIASETELPRHESESHIRAV